MHKGLPCHRWWKGGDPIGWCGQKHMAKLSSEASSFVTSSCGALDTILSMHTFMLMILCAAYIVTMLGYCIHGELSVAGGDGIAEIHDAT